MQPWCSALALLALIHSAPTGASVVLPKGQGGPVKEPAYKSEPRYCLLAFGPGAKTRVWLVLDGDTLYADRNGNGDLTEEAERYESIQDVQLKNLGGLRRNGKESHFRLSIQARKEGRASGNLWFALDDKTTVNHALTFTARPTDAQVSHFGGPLTFQRVGLDDPTLERGEKPPHFAVRIGTPGRPARGESSPVFAALACTEVPHDVHPTAEVEFPGKGAGDRPIKVRVRLDQRC